MKINFEPTNKQFELFECFDRKHLNHILLGGGVSGGKSYGLCALIIIKCLSFSRIRVGLARKNYTTLRKTTMVTMFKVLNDFGMVAEEHYKYNSVTGQITFLNTNSTVVLIDLDYLPSQPNYERLQGLELTFACVDEVGELIDRKGYDVLSSRVGRHLNKKFSIKPMMISTCNPSHNFIKEMFYEPWKIGKLTNDKIYIPTLITDNHYNDPEYIKNLEATLDPFQKKRLIDGDWDYEKSDLDLFDYVDLQNMYIQRDFPNGEKYLSVDIAVDSDDSVAVYWEGNDIKDILVNDKNTDSVLWMKGLMEEYGVNSKNLIYDASGIGGLIKKQLPSCVSFTGASKPLQKQNYKNIRHQTYFKLSEMVYNGEIMISTNKEKERLIKELRAVKRTEMVNNKVELEPKKIMIRLLGHSPDIADAISMKMFFNIKPVKIMYR